MKVRELRGVLLMAINQEFEHNVSQQLYVSDTLWQIIRMARNNTLAMVTMTGQDIDPESDSEALADALLKLMDEQQITPLQTAIMAVRTEAGKLF
jgi:D-arabinose 5-phosphate isomerase GutQ